MPPRVKWVHLKRQQSLSTEEFSPFPTQSGLMQQNRLTSLMTQKKGIHNDCRRDSGRQSVFSRPDTCTRIDSRYRRRGPVCTRGDRRNRWGIGRMILRAYPHRRRRDIRPGSSRPCSRTHRPGRSVFGGCFPSLVNNRARNWLRIARGGCMGGQRLGCHGLVWRPGCHPS